MTPDTSDTALIANRFKPLATLGEGAMGLVWLVEDPSTGKQAALKVISAKVGASADTLLQFKQEFRLMAQLRHPNCCSVYDYGQLPDGSPYFTMEVVPGHGLDELLPLSGATFIDVLSQLLLALGYVHQLGFVHCDLKSANVRLRPDGVVKLMDYGLMEYAGHAGGPIKGTLPYLSPEMVKRGPIDQRSDLYAVGCLAYEMLTGRLPFEPGTGGPMALLRAHVNDKPLPPSHVVATVDPLHELIVLKLLAKEPIERFQSAFEVLEALGVEVPARIGGNLLSSPMIGREGVLQELATGLARINAGETGGAVLVHGPAGVGKSRLVEEFKFRAQLENLPCHTGGWFEQGNAPYGPFVAILRSLLPVMRESIPAVLDQHGPVLVKLLPEVAAAPAPDMESPKNEMLRLQASITQVLVALAHVRPAILMLENWQWADPLSADLVDYLLRNSAGAPMMLILTAREASETGSWTVRQVPRLALAGLDEGGVRRMVTSMLGTTDLGASFLTRVTEFSEGNPYLVERLLEHLVQNMVLTNQRGAWNTQIELTAQQLPLNLNALLIRKFTSLSEAAKTVARYAAVIGRAIGRDLLKRLTGLGDEEFFEALDQLNQHQFLDPDENGLYQFSHGQMQELVYEQIDPDERPLLHDAVVAATEAQLMTGGRFDPVLLAQAPLPVVMAIAQHAIAGTHADKTILYALEAGLRNAKLFASADAERFLSAGLAKLADEPAGEWTLERLTYLRILGDVKRFSGKAAEAGELLAQALPLATTLGETFVLGRLLTSIGKAYQVQQKLDLALEYCTRSAEVCEQGGDAIGASRALMTISRVTFFQGNAGAATPHAKRAVELATQSGDQVATGLAQAFLGYLTVSADVEHLEEGIGHLRRSIDILSASGDKIGLNTSYNLLGNAQNQMGDFADARASFTQNKQLCFELGLQDEGIFASLNLSITASEQGQFPEAIGFAREARGTAERLNSRFPLGMAMALEALALAFLGEEAAARDLADQALVLSREIKHRYLESLVLQNQVEIYSHLGQFTEAMAAGAALRALIAESQSLEQENRLDALTADLLTRQGKLDEAGILGDKALVASRSARSMGIQVRALKALARKALLSEDFDKATTYATEALTISGRIGSRYQSTELRGMLGEAALALGSADARGHFEAMGHLAEAMNDTPLQAIALFGLAAADPYNGGVDRAYRATALLETWTQPMSEAGRAAFYAFAERERVKGGNYIGFGLPRRKRQATQELPPMGSRMGFGTGNLM